MATFFLTSDNLRLETNSVRRLDLIGKKIKRDLGEVVIKWREPSESVSDVLSQKKAQNEGEAETEVNKKCLMEYCEEYYKKWLDIPIPMLGGISPRQASRRSDKLSDPRNLLKYLENFAGHQKEKYSPLEKIKKELGIKL